MSVAVDNLHGMVRFGVDDTFETVSFDDGPRVLNDGPLRVGGHQSADGTDNHFLRGAIDEMRISRGFLLPEQLLNAPMPDCNRNSVWDLLEILVDVDLLAESCDLDNQVPPGSTQAPRARQPVPAWRPHTVL